MDDEQAGLKSLEKNVNGQLLIDGEKCNTQGGKREVETELVT